MILVGQYDSPFVRRVAVTLHLYGMDFTRNAISVFGDAAEMARINPLVRIPSLVLDDGEVLVESAAILDYLDDKAGPARALTPRSGAQRRRVLKLTAIATGAGEKAGAIVYERHFHAANAVNHDWVARCREQLDGGLAWLEHALGDAWFVGDRMSQADVTASCVIFYLQLRLAEAFDAARYPKLARLGRDCEALPAFVAARPSPDEVMPG